MINESAISMLVFSTKLPVPVNFKMWICGTAIPILKKSAKAKSLQTELV